MAIRFSFRARCCRIDAACLLRVKLISFAFTDRTDPGHVLAGSRLSWITLQLIKSLPGKLQFHFNVSYSVSNSVSYSVSYGVSYSVSYSGSYSVSYSVTCISKYRFVYNYFNYECNQ